MNVCHKEFDFDMLKPCLLRLLQNKRIHMNVCHKELDFNMLKLCLLRLLQTTAAVITSFLLYCYNANFLVGAASQLPVLQISSLVATTSSITANNNNSNISSS